MLGTEYGRWWSSGNSLLLVRGTIPSFVFEVETHSKAAVEHRCKGMSVEDLGNISVASVAGRGS